jgi:hypothetical protein
VEAETLRDISNYLGWGPNTSNQRAYRAWTVHAARSAPVFDRDDHAPKGPEVAKFAADAIGKQSNPTTSIVVPPFDMPMSWSIVEPINDPGYGLQWREALAKNQTHSTSRTKPIFKV